MNIYTIIFIVIGGIWLVGLFLGFITGVQKTFKNDPAASVNSEVTKDKQSQFIEETDRLRKEKMEQLKQRMDDQKRMGR